MRSVRRGASFRMRANLNEAVRARPVRGEARHGMNAARELGVEREGGKKENASLGLHDGNVTPASRGPAGEGNAKREEAKGRKDWG